MENRIEKAKELFSGGCNCAQAVVGAYCDLFGLSFEDAMRTSEALGGGLGRLRRTCGAVTGLCMLASLKYSGGNPLENDTRAVVYAKVQELVAEFEKMHGTSICGELLGETVKKDSSPIPEARTSEYFKKRPCAEYVGICAKMAEDYLLRD